MRHLLLFAVLLTTACDPYAAAQKADSIEGYEQFLEANPSSPWRPMAQDRLQLLEFEVAKTANTLPAYDAWLAKFPTSPMRDEVIAAREGSLFAWARSLDTVESWGVFISEYPNSRRRPNADKSLRAATHAASVRIDAVSATRTNLAEDPEGPLNGWLLSAQVHNIGPTALRKVVLSPSSPPPLSTIEWPVAASRWTLPLSEEQRQPLRSGDSRTWTWTTDEMDASWDGQFELVLADAET